MIKKPMLAAKLTSFDKLVFDNNYYLATPKIDGIRALKIKGQLVSRSFKPIRNTYIRTILERNLPDGADGEIIVGNNFQDCTSGIMTESGEPDFTFYMFDYVSTDLKTPYKDRIDELIKWRKNLFGEEAEQHIKLLIPKRVNSIEELKSFEEECLNDGYEGVVLRTPNSPYKCGRATEREQFLLKIKRFLDAEGVVIGFKEEMKNMNESTKDNFGRTERSSHKDNLIPMNTLDTFQVTSIDTGVTFDIPARKGLTDAQRKQLWKNRKDLVGCIIKYSYFPVGVKNKPRHPQFLGFRDIDDIQK